MQIVFFEQLAALAAPSSKLESGIYLPRTRRVTNRDDNFRNEISEHAAMVTQALPCRKRGENAVEPPKQRHLRTKGQW